MLLLGKRRGIDRNINVGYNYYMCCVMTKTALDVLESQGSRKSLTRSETIMLFKQVIADQKEVGNRMTKLEQRMDSVENKLDKVLEIVSKPSVGSVIKEVLSNKVFVYILVTLFAAMFGVGVSGVGIDLLK